MIVLFKKAVQCAAFPKYLSRVSIPVCVHVDFTSVWYSPAGEAIIIK